MGAADTGPARAEAVHLADVNVFFALLWPKHDGHKAAHDWFSRAGFSQTGLRAGAGAWATNPLTQLGVLRLLTNPAITRSAVSVDAALALVTQACRHPGHVFWPLDGDLPSGLRERAARIQDYRQWTDAALLRQAEERRGVLVTFDSGIRQLAGDRAADLVLVLKAT